MLIQPSLSDAIVSLRPGAEWVLTGSYENLEWLDQIQTKPTQQELETELARLQQIYDDTEYMRLRHKEYPNWRDQLDLLYQGYDIWKAAIQAIKDKYPKPQ